MLLEGHGDPQIDAQVQLDPESFDRIVTWIDINAPYYPEYASAYGGNRYGRSPLSDEELQTLERLTGSSDINLTRPALSPCLAKFSDPADPNRLQALQLIQRGRSRLAQRPRADMPGFHLVVQNEIAQQAKYDTLRTAEAQARQAIIAGQKFYGAGRPAK